MKKIIVVFITIMCFFNISGFAENDELRVGVYPNPPLVDYNEEVGVTGFFVELMNYIAREEEWTLDYEHYFLGECFEKVENQELDLLLAVAHTEERDKKYIYNKETFYTNWGQLYTNKNHVVSAFTDLDGKIIGVEKGDIHYVGENGIKNTLEAFNIHAYYVEYDGRMELLQDLEDNKVEVAVVSRLYGEFFEGDYDIDMTPIQFNPIKIKIIASSDRGAFYLSQIDERMAAMKDDKSSFYYEALNDLIGAQPTEMLPSAFKYAVVILCAALAGAILAIAAYRRKIKVHEDHIEKQNEYLKLLIKDITNRTVFRKWMFFLTVW